MQYVTALIFEYTPACNRANEHTWCPSSSSERWAGLNTTQHLEQVDIVRLASEAWHDYGFRGLFGFHYYNEPMLYFNKLMSLVSGIRAELPESRFVLWTNGDHFREYMKPDLANFETIMVTDYGDLDVDLTIKVAPHASIVKVKRDQRKIAIAEWYAEQETHHCFRPGTELVVDYHGNLHFCCYDWRGLSSPGNLLTSDTKECIENWQRMRDAIFTAEQMKDMPIACRRCPYRDIKLQVYDDEAGGRIIEHIRELRGVSVA